MHHKYFVSAIDTNSGKTVISSLLCQAFGFDYFKPIQCGWLPKSDKNIVRDLVTNQKSKIHNEIYIFRQPMSPHHAAILEEREIKISEIKIPDSENGMIIEGAGGLLVPLNQKHTFADFILRNNLELILVVNFYLGSINHTNLNLEFLARSGIQVKGIVFNGKMPDDSYRIIEKKLQWPLLIHQADIIPLSAENIAHNADQFREKTADYFNSSVPG